MTKDKQNELMDHGFKNAISLIYHNLDDAQKAEFTAKFTTILGDTLFTEAVAEVDNTVSECPRGEVYVPGKGCVPITPGGGI